MKKEIIAVLAAAVLITGCGDIPYSRADSQGTAVKPEVGRDFFRAAAEKEKRRADVGAAPEAVQASVEPETVREAADRKSVAVLEAAADRKPEAVLEAAAASAHVCRGDSGSTVTVLAFGEHEPDCFYGAKYDVKCGDCGKCIDVIYREPLGHAGDEGVVTCQPDCTGGGSIRYTCVRCGAEWSEAYGQAQPHTWVEGSRKETDWLNGGTKEVSYLYCSVCGKREETE